MPVEPYEVTAHINGQGDVKGIVDMEKPSRNGGKLLRFKAEGLRQRWISDATAFRT